MTEGIQRERKSATQTQIDDYNALVQAGGAVSFVEFFKKHLDVDFDAAFEDLGESGQDWVVNVLKDVRL
jgi:hypothetical protein